MASEHCLLVACNVLLSLFFSRQLFVTLAFQREWQGENGWICLCLHVHENSRQFPENYDFSLVAISVRLGWPRTQLVEKKNLPLLGIEHRPLFQQAIAQLQLWPHDSNMCVDVCVWVGVVEAWKQDMHRDYWISHQKYVRLQIAISFIAVINFIK